MAEATAGAASAAPSASGISRREFLYYIWGASMALFTAEFTGLLVWFALPRFREGTFGGTFTLRLDQLPPINDPPFPYTAGQFWLVNLDSEQANERMYRAEDEAQPIRGVAAIYKVCTHLGCIYAWVQANNRFECPCHGSKYRLDGRRVESPAPRTLDRFEVTALDASEQPLGTSQVDEDNFYAPLELPAGTAFLRIDTGAKKQGPSPELLCSFTGNCP
jgi:cytochrome b6-f complex iron-sulfur subunit